MCVRRGGNRKVDGAPSRLAATRDNSRCEPSPLPRDSRVYRKRIEGRFHDAQPLGPARPFVVRIGDQDSEVQFGE